jgi:Holliday junction resolvase RusA-like endonuclease
MASWEAAAQMREQGARMMEGPLSVSIRAGFAPPKSWPKWKLEVARSIWHTRRPDGDNVVKAVLDALQGVAFREDSHVAKHGLIKHYTDEPGVLVSIESIDGLHSESTRADVSQNHVPGYRLEEVL